jgi:hypothetical protein
MERSCAERRLTVRLPHSRDDSQRADALTRCDEIEGKGNG